MRLGLQVLGRALLQSVFQVVLFCSNCETTQVSGAWAAQAPGPGAGKQGLGFTPQDLQESATTLDLYEGDNLFRDSWAGIWTPLASTNQTRNHLSQAQNLTKSDIAGVVVGVVVAVAIVVGGGCFVARRRKETEIGKREPETSYEKAELDTQISSKARTTEIDGDACAEVGYEVGEMPVGDPSVELAAPHGASEVRNLSRYELGA